MKFSQNSPTTSTADEEVLEDIITYMAKRQQRASFTISRSKCMSHDATFCPIRSDRYRKLLFVRIRGCWGESGMQ